MPRKATQKDIDEAKEYLRKRLDAERSMSRNLENLFKKAIEAIVLICFKYNLNPAVLNSGKIPMKAQKEIDSIIDWLRNTIEDYFEALVTAAPDSDKDFIIPWIKGRRFGSTFDQRLEDYMDKFRFEIYLLTAAGIAIGFGSVGLVRSLWNNLKKPWDNPELKDALKEKPSYGVGKSNAMFNAVNNLTKNAIALAWIKTKIRNEQKKGATGWWVERGSTYPCDICDSMTGFHYNDDFLPLYHTSCCCIAVPVYSENPF